MYDEESMKKMVELFANPLFKKNFFEFFVKMQKEGIESARKFWGQAPGTDMFADATELFEKMVDFYIILGFVPQFKYEGLVKENERLKKEVELLRSTMKELQVNFFSEGGENARELWKSIIDKQFEINKEMSKNYFELLKSLR